MIRYADLAPSVFVNGVPDGEFQRLIAEEPLSYTTLPDGTTAWNLVRAEDVSRGLALLERYRTPSVDESVDEFPAEWSVSAMMTLGGPRHTAARHACAPLVERDRVSRVRAVFADLAQRRVSGVRGMFELVEDVTAPLAAHMGAAYLGVAPENYEYFRRLAAVFMADTLPPRTVGRPATAVLGPVARAAADRSPAQAAVELIRENFTGLPWAEQALIDGLPRSAIEDWGMQFVTAGTGGTRACFTYAVLLLNAEWPAWRSRIKHEPALLANIAQEVIRLASPLLRVRRILTERTILYDTVIDAGETVLLWLSAANRDPGVFVDPTSFRPYRPARRNFSFGGGPHHCLGHPVARIEVEEFIRAALDSWRAVEIVGPVQRSASNVVNEIAAVEVRAEEISPRSMPDGIT